MRTWQVEMAVVMCVLAVIAWLGGRVEDWVGSAAVCLSFGHMQVADRIAERSRGTSSAVECEAWLDRYLLTKEVTWMGYFLLAHAWPALAASAMFALYPVWRRAYRKKYPTSLPQTGLRSCHGIRANRRHER